MTNPLQVYIQRNSGSITGYSVNPQPTDPSFDTTATSWTDATFQAWLTAQSTSQTLAQTYTQKIAAGIQVTSTGTPGLNGTYGIAPSDVSNIQAVSIYIQVNGRFPAGQTAFPWKDQNGLIHSFATTASFMSFATVAADYVAALALTLHAYEAGGSPPWPSNSATIP